MQTQWTLKISSSFYILYLFILHRYTAAIIYDTIKKYTENTKPIVSEQDVLTNRHYVTFIQGIINEINTEQISLLHALYLHKKFFLSFCYRLAAQLKSLIHSFIHLNKFEQTFKNISLVIDLIGPLRLHGIRAVRVGQGACSKICPRNFVSITDKSRSSLKEYSETLQPDQIQLQYTTTTHYI